MSNKATAYNLFMSNALKYGWSVGAPVLIWQTDPGLSLTYANALIYAQYLEADGVTVSATPQNIWRVPKIYEILTAHVNSIFYESTPYPGGFIIGRSYWSNNGATIYYTYFSAHAVDFDFDGSMYVPGPYYIRCVKI